MNAAAASDAQGGCECNVGFARDSATGTCNEIVDTSVPNACPDGITVCASNASCVEQNGSFGCVCDAGHQGDGFFCADVNECQAGTDQCSVLATCSNTAGSYTCACRVGFVGDGRSCIDVNECEDGTASCDENALCIDQPGTFS